jgi:hypothetical protein
LNKSFIISVNGSSEIKSRVVLLSVNVPVTILSSTLMLIFILSVSSVDDCMTVVGEVLPFTLLLSVPQTA